jgi:membrane-bound ClpP family serine protease
MVGVGAYVITCFFCDEENVGDEAPITRCCIYINCELNMQDEFFLLAALGAALLVSLLSSFFLYRTFPFFNFLEWFGTVFLLVGWYSLFIPSTMEFVILGKWVNATQLAGFIAADLFPLLLLCWAVYRRRKTYKSKQAAGGLQS